jgi:hypothetical protein
MACHTACEILGELVSSNSVGNVRNFGSLLAASILQKSFPTDRRTILEKSEQQFFLLPDNFDMPRTSFGTRALRTFLRHSIIVNRPIAITFADKL